MGLLALSIFVERSTPKIGALVPKRRVRTALAHKPGQTRPQESGILRNVTYRQDIRGDFVFFKTLTRRRNPVSQLGMRVAVQIFACPLIRKTIFQFIVCRRGSGLEPPETAWRTLLSTSGSSTPRPPQSPPKSRTHPWPIVSGDPARPKVLN